MIESAFAKFQLLSRDAWQSELSIRDDLNEAQKQELAELLTAHQSMPTAFMDVERIRERRNRATAGSEIVCKDLEAGDVVGSYVLEAILGEGGFGIVWRAKQTEPVVREVALKILKLGMDSAEILKRFMAEQQMLAMMGHPNIATLIEAGITEDGRPFFAMELVKGSPITKYCDERRLSIQERLEVFVDVCLAVNHAHQKGAIHRDLKPSNILVFDDASGPIAKVIDFGISQATKKLELQYTKVVTARGEIIGTPAYMAPEQFSSGNPIDTRADIYALGAILHELLVGTPPDSQHRPIKSTGSKEPVTAADRDVATLSTVLRFLDAEDRTAIAQRRRIPKSKLQTLVSGDLKWIAMKALEREPARRYATVVGLVNDIRKSQADEPIAARPPNRLYLCKRYIRRNRSAVFAGCFIMLALFSAAFFGMHQAWSSRKIAVFADRARLVEKEMRERSEFAARLAERAEKKAIEQRERTRRHAYAANMLLAFQSHRMNDLRKTNRLLHQNQQVENAQDLRGWEWRYLFGQTQSRRALDVGLHSERVLSALFSASGENLITLEDHGRIALRNLSEDFSELVLSEDSEGSRLSSSGGFLTVSTSRTMVAGLHFSEITDDYVIKIWSDLMTSPIRSLNVGQRRPTGLALSPDGNLVAFFIPAEGHALILDVISGAVVHREKLNHGNIGRLDQEGACSFSADGELLAIGGNHGRIVIVQAPNWSRWPGQLQAVGRVTTLAFSPDRRQLAAGSLFQDPRVSVFDLTGEAKDRQLTGHSGFIAKVAFSPDGSLLASASADQNIKLWRTSDWSEAANLSGHQDEVWSVDFAPGGRRLVSASKDRSVKLWNIDDWLDQEKATFVVEKPFDGQHASLAPGGTGGLTVQGGTVSFHGNFGEVPKLKNADISQAYWISADRLVCGSTARPEITIRNLAGRVEQRLELPEGVVNHRCEYLGESGILVVAMEFPGSERVRFDRYDITSLELLSSSSLEVPDTVWKMLGHDHRGICSFSYDGKQVALKSGWGSVSVYDLLTGETVAAVDVSDKHGIQGMCLSPDGKTLAYAVRKRPIIEIHDIATGRSCVRLAGHNLVIRRLYFSPDGERLVSTGIGSEQILLWDTTEWRQVASFDPTPGFAMAHALFLPSGDGLVIRETALGNASHQFRCLMASPSPLINKHEEKRR